MTALRDSPAPEPEVLIEEARRRQRRRRRTLAGLMIAVVVAGGFWITAGGGPPSRSGPVGHGGRTPSPTGSWHALSGVAAGITRGAQIISVVQYRGELVATGTLCAVSELAGGCEAQDDPVIWVSRTGAAWRRVFAARAVGALDYGREQLLVTSSAVYLLNRGESSGPQQPAADSKLWRSTNLSHWQAVTLPGRYATTADSAASASGNRVILNGPDSAWSSTGGGPWTSVRTPSHPTLRGLAISGSGRALWAIATPANRYPAALAARLMWRSTDNGTSWSPIHVPNRGAGAVQLVAGKGGLLIANTRWSPKPGVLWWTPRSGTWHNASMPRLPATDSAGLVLYKLTDGFLAAGNPAGAGRGNQRAGQWMLWSKNGRTWVPVKINTQLPAGYSPSVTVPLGNTLLVVEQKTQGSGSSIAAQLPTGANALWRLTLNLPAAR